MNVSKLIKIVLLALLTWNFLCLKVYAGGNLLIASPENPTGAIVRRWDERMMPIEWQLSSDGQPNSDVSNDFFANDLITAFNRWQDVDSSYIRFTYGGEINRRSTSDDGVNLITFTDSEVEFPPGVAGLAFAYAFHEETVIDDSNNDLNGDGTPDIPNGTYAAGTIYDADILFHPNLPYSSTTALHEIGHISGLSHSSISESIMWPFGRRNIDDIRLDDIAHISRTYPQEPQYSQQYGSVTGVVTNGFNGIPILGAHVYAVDINTGNKIIGAYSLRDGSYELPLPSGSYYIGIEPLDGDPEALSPERINQVIEFTDDTFFIEELFDANESNIESDPLSALPVSVVAGSTTQNIDFQTNITGVPGVSRVLREGINYFSFPIAVPTDLSAYDLLEVLGDANEINSIEWLNPHTQLYERASYINGAASGRDFPIRRGEGYIVYAQQQTVVTFRGTPDCPEISLVAGINLIGVPCPPSSYSAYDLIEHIGNPDEVVAIRRYNHETASFEDVQYNTSGGAIGVDFPITNGEAYFVELRVDKSNIRVPGPTAIFPPAITNISPGRALAGELVLIQGEGFSEDLLNNYVSFNGEGAFVVFASTDVIAAIVPENTTSGPVVVTANNRASNTIDFIIETNDIVENTTGLTGTTEILAGQTASGELTVDTEQDRYTVIALEGALLDISATVLSGNPDLMLALESPSGVLLVSDDDSGPNNSPMIRRFELPETGVYSIVVTSVSGTGRYALSLDISNTALSPTISVLQGDIQSTLMGTDLPLPLEVYVTGSNGQPLVGVPVTFTASNVELEASAQGFSLANAGTEVVTTNLNGIATVEATAPNMPGVFDIIVTVPGLEPVTMQVSTTSTAVTQVERLSASVETCGGEGCEVGQAVFNPYALRYLNSDGLPVANVLTGWRSVAGGGSLENLSPISSSSNTSLSDGTGIVSATHVLGEQLFAEFNGRRTGIKLPQVVAVTVPGQRRPLLFSAQSKAGPPASIETLGSVYRRLPLGSVTLNAIAVLVEDAFGNPVEGAQISHDDDIFDLRPGTAFLNSRTNENGIWVASIEQQSSAIATIDEFGTRDSQGLASTYELELTQAQAGSAIYNVDIDMGPALGSVSGQNLQGFVGEPLPQNPIGLQLFRVQRLDSLEDSDASWQNEEFTQRRSTRLPMSAREINYIIQRSDRANPRAAGVLPTLINNDTQATQLTESNGRGLVDITLGDVGGRMVLVGGLTESVEIQLEDAGNVISPPVVFPLEELRRGGIIINSIPVEVRATIDADALSGLDWATLRISLNGSTTIFDGASGEVPDLRSFPNNIRVFIDGGEQLVWPSAELLEAGGFSQLVVVYEPLASDLVDGSNTVTISGEVTEFDNTVTTVTEDTSFTLTNNLNNAADRIWNVAQSFDAESFFTIGRTTSLAQIHDQPITPAGNAVGSFRTFNVPLIDASSVEVEILDHQKNPVSTLIPRTDLPVGDHRFVLLREDISSVIVPRSGRHDLYVRVRTTSSVTDQTRTKLYSGELNDSVTGKMLGQVIQHDTLIQDGSLTLRREDVALKGAGPQLNFIRSYSNSRQPENDDTDLGPGWTHNHNIFARVLAAAPIGPFFGERLPGWIANTRSGFGPRILTANALSNIIQSAGQPVASMVSISNGGVFERDNTGAWVGQRGNHGTLTGSVSDGLVYTSKDGTQYNFRATANRNNQYPVESVVDRNGNTLTYTYQNERLSQVTDQSDRYLSFVYRREESGYLRLSNVQVIADTSDINSPQNFALSFNYFKRESTDPAEVASELDEISMLQGFQRDEFTETYDYEAALGDNEPNLISVVDANGHTTLYQYYASDDVPSNFGDIAPGTPRSDLVHRVCYPTSATSNGSCGRGFAEFTYDTTNGSNARVVTDLRGNDTRYILNTWGNPMRIEEPEGKITEFDWSIDLNEPDNLIRVKRDISIGATWEYQYDAKGNLTQETDPFNREVTQTWDQQFSILLTRTDKNGHEFSQVLDENGNVVQEIQQALVGTSDTDEASINVTTTHTYGSRAGIHGLRVMTLDGRENTKEYDYDDYGNMTSFTELDSVSGDSETEYEYNARGLKVSETDPNRNTTTYVYDALDRLTLTTDGEGNTTAATYDAKGNMLSERMADSYGEFERSTLLQYSYDERDRVTSIERSGGGGGTEIGGQKTFSYDPNSNVVSESDWKGEDTTHVYDELNRLTLTTNRVSDSMEIAYEWQLGQDGQAGGLRKTITDYRGNDTEEQYDALDRLTRIDHPLVTNSDESLGDYHREIEYDGYENITRILDEEGRETRFVYDPRYLKIQQINDLGDAYRWEYDENGNQTKTTDEMGRETDYTYDAQDRLVTKEAPEDHNWAYSYYPNGMTRSMTDPWGFVFSYTYNRINQRTSMTDPDGITQEVYTKDGELASSTDPEGRTITNIYGPEGRLVQSTDARGRTTTQTFDHNNNVTRRVTSWGSANTGPASVTMEYEYDDLDRVITETEAASSSAIRIARLAYDPQSNLTSRRYPDGRFMEYEYDELNRVKRINGALGTTTGQIFDGVGNLTSVTDRRGHTTTTSYDQLHRPHIITDPDGFTITYTYDAVGNVLTETDKRDHTRVTIYDDLNRPTQVSINPTSGGFRLLTTDYDVSGLGTGQRADTVTDAENNPVTSHMDFRGNVIRTNLPAGNGYGEATAINTYDRSGFLTSSRDAQQLSTTYTNFNDGNIATMTNHESETTEYQYDIFGNRVRITKPRGNAQVSTYDARNRLVQVEDDNNQITRFEYDVNSNLTDQYTPGTSGGDTHVRYEYDALNRKTAHRQPNGLTTMFAYDPEGNLTQLTDPNRQIFRYTYDRLNRLDITTFPSGDDITSINNDYDANGNMTLVTESKPTGAEITRYNYDLLDRMTLRNQRGHAVTYVYDNNGNRTSVTAPGGITTYTYDGRNRLATANSGQLTTYLYTQNGWLRNVTHGNNTSVTYTHDGVGRVETITNRASDNSLLSSFSYDYDDNGNRTQQIEVQNGFADNQTVTTDYIYDNLDRLTRFTETTGSDQEIHNYTYFPSYDRHTEIVTRNGVEQTNRTFAYDLNYRVTGITESAGSGGTISYVYDNNGNTLSKADTTSSGPASTVFTYNRRNQLKTVAAGEAGAEIGQGEYDYNYDGMRIRHMGSNRGDVEYIYDDQSIIDEVVNGTTTQIAHYRYGDRLLSLNTSAGEQFYHYASLGTTANLTDTSGNNLVAYRVDPFGEITRQEGESVNRQVFTGHEHDEETGLIYMKARFYDPDIGRFLNQDTYLGENNTPPSLHRYLYAYSNPTMYVDLDGYSSTKFDFAKSDSSIKPKASFGGKQTDGATVGDKLAQRHADRGPSSYEKWVDKCLQSLQDDCSRGRFDRDTAGQREREKAAPTLTEESGNVDQQIAEHNKAQCEAASSPKYCGDNEFVVDVTTKLGIGLIGLDAVRSLGRKGGPKLPKVKAPTSKVNPKTKGSTQSPSQKKRSGDGCSCGAQCFAAGTLVQTKEGLLPIEEVKEGQLVAAKDEITGDVTWKPVTTLFQYDDDRITYALVLKGNGGALETFEVTDNHPFYVENIGWVDSIDLQPGMQVPSYHGGVLEVVSLTSLNRSPVTYNFEVEDYHTYFVGEVGAWVHNMNKRCGCGDETEPSYYEGKVLQKTSPKASKMKTLVKGSREWKEAVKAMQEAVSNGKKFQVKVNSSSDAKAFLKEAQGNMDRRKAHTQSGRDDGVPKYKKGYEQHQAPEGGVQDRPHIKYYNNGTDGHIFYNVTE